MNNTFRILLALAIFMAIVAIGLNGAAWADKLNFGANAPLNGAAGQNLAAGTRPQGTVIIINPVVILQPGVTATVGNCSTALVTTPPSGLVYTVSVISSDVLPKVFPGNLLSCAIKIEVKPGTSIGAEVQLCFPVPPSQNGFAYNHDGTKWIKTTSTVNNGQSCVILAATASTPAYAGLFDK